MPTVEVGGTKIVYEEGYYLRVRPDGSAVILPIERARPVPDAEDTASAATSADGPAVPSDPRSKSGAISSFNTTGHLPSTNKEGTYLGDDVWIPNGEQIYCFRWKSSLQTGKAEGVAVARGHELYVDGTIVSRSKGSVLQPALHAVQHKIGDISPTLGGPTSLNPWNYWYLKRDGRFIPLGTLRDPANIRRRRRRGRDDDLPPL